VRRRCAARRTALRPLPLGADVGGDRAVLSVVARALHAVWEGRARGPSDCQERTARAEGWLLPSAQDPAVQTALAAGGATLVGREVAMVGAGAEAGVAQAWSQA
jgi:hypothetical protein